MSLVDITDNWTAFLNELYEMGTVLKVPGRKAKRKLYCCLLHQSPNIY